MSKITVLQVLGEPIANGGQESYIMNMYRNIDREKVQFDFFTPFTVDNKDTKSEIESMGGKVFSGDLPFGVDNNKYFKQGTEKFFSEHKYDYVHIHSGSTFALMSGAKLAKNNGAVFVATHSHAGGFANLKYKVIRVLSKKPLEKYPTHRFACSTLAAKWKYSDKIIQSGDFTVLKNAVDTDKFRYNADVREKMRTQFGVENKLVIGHIGRFSTQKNHHALIDIFADIKANCDNAVLVLVGEGELEGEIKDKVRTLDLQDSVSFLGIRRDVPDLLNMFDVFLLPSFYEGNPMVCIEAQATGLATVMADTVTSELPIKELSSYVSLEAPMSDWTNAVIAASKTERKDSKEQMIQSGFDVKVAANILQEIYLGNKII